MRILLFTVLVAASMVTAAQETSGKRERLSTAGRVPAMSYSVFATGLAEPRGLRFAPSGDLYVAEQKSGEIARINPAGSVTRIARGLAGPHDLALDADGNLYVAEMHANRVAMISRAGSVSTYIPNINAPVDLDFGPRGELFVCELYNGRVTAFKGRKFERVVASGLRWPHGLAFDPAGAIFINENTGNRIVKVAPTGAVQPFAQIDRPVGLALGKSGDLYVAQPQVGKVSRVTSDGRVTVLFEGLNEPRDPVFDAAGNLYFAETMAGRILKVSGKF